MSSLALSFHEVNFNPIAQHDGQIWLKASELAQALGYSRVDSVTRLYNSNNDEFDETMTQVIDFIENTDSVLPKQHSNLVNKIRIFSLRGCHLLAMFARTKVAKEFRKWALNIIAKAVGQPVAKTHKSEREPLTNAVNMLVAKTKHLNYSDAYKLVHQRFNVDHIEDIPYDAIPVAVEYVHHLIALYSNASKQGTQLDSKTYELVRHLCERIVLENDEVVALLEKFRGILDNRKFLFYANYIVRSNEAARNLSWSLGFKNGAGEPLIDPNCRTIALSTGQRFAARPNWFNCPA